MPVKKSGVQPVKDDEPVKRIPASENGPGVQLITKSGEKYQVSQCIRYAGEPIFTLWHETPDGFVRMSTADDPRKLYDLVDLFS